MRRATGCTRLVNVMARPRLSLPLEQVRVMLFPNLPPDEGRARVHNALDGAADIDTWKRIEKVAAIEPDLMPNLMAALRDRQGKAGEPHHPSV
jgi:hypothetical protein